MPDTAIPLLDLGPYFAGEPGAFEATATELRRICETVGFLFIANHGVPFDLVRETFEAAARFHAQPMEAKLAVKLDDAMQGYLPYRSSTTRANGLVAVRKPNENEAFFVNPERDPAQPANRWPAAIPEFGPTVLRYFAALEDLWLRLLPLYARALGMPDDFFGPLCDRSLSTLRLTHYPPVAYGADEYGIAPHTDSSFFTLLAQNPVPGLQIRTRDGEWISAPVIPETFVVNTGDVLNRWSNGRFLSDAAPRLQHHGLGRATPSPSSSTPNPETLIEALPSCVGPGDPARFPAQTVGEYMAWFRGQNYAHFRKETAAAE